MDAVHRLRSTAVPARARVLAVMTPVFAPVVAFARVDMWSSDAPAR